MSIETHVTQAAKVHVHEEVIGGNCHTVIDIYDVNGNCLYTINVFGWDRSDFVEFGYQRVESK